MRLALGGRTGSWMKTAVGQMGFLFRNESFSFEAIVNPSTRGASRNLQRDETPAVNRKRDVLDTIHDDRSMLTLIPLISGRNQ